jgi:hypothetical protein
MQPEAVAAGLEAARYLRSPTELCGCTRLDILDQRQEHCCIPAIHTMQPGLFGARQPDGNEPRRQAELDGNVNGVLDRHAGRLLI